MNSITLLESGNGRMNSLIYLVTEQIAQQVANVKLHHEKPPVNMGSDICTVYTSTRGAYQVRFTLCAEVGFLHRAAENMLGESVSDFEDIEESAKEFFNILCGHIVGEISRQYCAKASFFPPRFVQGKCFSELSGGRMKDSVSLISNQNERVLVFYD